jgi:hypothetical protein
MVRLSPTDGEETCHAEPGEQGSARSTTSILLLVCFVVLVTAGDHLMARADDLDGTGANAGDRTADGRSAGADSLAAPQDTGTPADDKGTSLWSWIKRHPKIVIGTAAAAVVTAIIIVTRDGEEDTPPDLPGFPPPPEG